MEKVKKSSGFYELDYTSIKILNQKVPATASAPDDRSLANGKTQQEKPNPGEAELWQINEFLQSEKERQPDTELVLHAERVNYHRTNGAKVEKIRFYTRPKTEEKEKGVFAFLDNLINKSKKNQNDENLANDTLAGLAKSYIAAADIIASRPTLHSSLNRLIQRSASPSSGSIAPDLMVVATAIKNEKYESATETALAKSSTFREAVFAEINIYRNESQGFTEQKTLEGLTFFRFQMKEIMAFERLVSNIADNKNGDDEDLYEIDRFRKQWIELHDSNTLAGKEFRDFVRDNPTCKVWNTVAHRLVERVAPTFDFDAHTNQGNVIMLPEFEHFQASPRASVLREIVNELHSHASRTKRPRFSNMHYYGEKVLVVAKSCIIKQRQDYLHTGQLEYLRKTYESVFNQNTFSAKKIILIPLFNYTESTINQCIDLMLAPAKKALQRGEKLALGISTPDPRIKLKFDKAVLIINDELREQKDETLAVPKGNNSGEHQVIQSTEQGMQTANLPAIRGSAVEDMYQFINKGIETFKQHADVVHFNSAATAATAATSAAATMAVTTMTSVAATAATVATFATQRFEAFKESLPILTPQRIFGDQDADENVMHSTKQPLVKPDSPLSVAVEVMAAKEKTGQLAVANALANTYSGAGGHDATVVLERRPLPKMKMKKKKPGSPVKVAVIAEPSAQKTTSLHSARTADSGIEYVKLQNGITGANWWPDEKTVILLSDSADNCIQPGQTDIESELNTLLKEDTFSTFRGNGLIFKPQSAKNDIPQNQNRFFVFAEKLQAGANAEIAERYMGMAEEAARMGINKLVITPCFDRPANNLFSDQKPYKKAIGTTIKTLDELTIKFPELDITLVARSEAEKALMHDAIEAWSQEKQRKRLSTN